MCMGWQKIGNKRYYFIRTGMTGQRGRMATGWQKIGNYRFYFVQGGNYGVKGAAMTGLKKLSDGTYYFKTSGGDGVYGRMLTGWQEVSGQTYYFGQDGKEKTIELKGYLFQHPDKLANALGNIEKIRPQWEDIIIIPIIMESMMGIYIFFCRQRV